MKKDEENRVDTEGLVTEAGAAGRSPRAMLRAAARRWYAHQMQSLDRFSTESADLHVRSTMKSAADFARFYGRSESGEGFARVLRGVLLHADRMTIEEQTAMETYIKENPTEAALTMQLALG